MDVNLLLKTFGFMLVFYLIAKALAPFLTDLFSNKNKNNDHDIDAMIKRKMEYLQVTGKNNPGTTSAAATKKENTKRKDYIEEVKNLFRELSQDSKKTEAMRQQMLDLKRTLELLDALQWGTSPELSNVRKRFEKNFDIGVPEEMVLAALRISLAHAPLFNERKEPIPCDELIDLCTVISFHQCISTTLGEGTPVQALQLCKRWHCDLLTLQRAWFTWLAAKEKCELGPLMAELLELSELSARDLQRLLGHGPQSLPWESILKSHGRAQKPEELLEEIKEELTVMRAITPLALCEPLDQTQALAIMGFQHVPAPGILSRRYKKLARLWHPDKLSAYGFAPNIIELASTNFKTMKSAYDFLRKDME